jgi:hypothetical protein
VPGCFRPPRRVLTLRNIWKIFVETGNIWKVPGHRAVITLIYVTDNFSCLIQTVFDQAAVQAAADKYLFPGRLKADAFYQFTVAEVQVGLGTFTALF